MTGVYVPYCKNKMASEDLLTSHRTYLSVSQSVYFCLCGSMNILVTNTLPVDEVQHSLSAILPYFKLLCLFTKNPHM